MIKTVVTGGRTFSDKLLVFAALDELRPDLVIHGGATGADDLAWLWARNRGVQWKVCKAPWLYLKKYAGAARNTYMLGLRPDYVVAFEGGRGTRDCITKALKMGIPVKKIHNRRCGLRSSLVSAQCTCSWSA